MFRYLSLVLPLLAASGIRAIDVDSGNTDSLKSAAKDLARGIVTVYNSNENDFIPGLLPDMYFFWESGLVMNTLVDYATLTDDTQFNDLVKTGLQFQKGDTNSYLPANQTRRLMTDDQSSWGLAALTAAEAGWTAEGNGTSYLELAKNVFDTQAARWNDESCGGGLKWGIFSFNGGYSYRNSVSAAQFFLLSARLYRATGNETYSQWADKTFQWVRDVGFMSDDYQVYDGAGDGNNCTKINPIQWTYNSAMFMEGAALMYNLTTSSTQESWKSHATGLWNSSSIFLLQNATSTADKNILVEAACYAYFTCNIDQLAFRGIALRSYAHTALLLPSLRDAITPVLFRNAEVAGASCEGEKDELICAPSWDTYQQEEEGVTGTPLDDGGLSEVLSALSAELAVLRVGQGEDEGVKGNGTASGSGSGNGTGADATGSGTAAAPKATGAAGRIGVQVGILGIVGLVGLMVL